jgi:phosphohistidine phosphatase
MNLIILRHSNAEDLDEKKYPEDSLRPLTKKGVKRIHRVAKLMRKFKINVDYILSSPAIRAYDTARVVRKEFKLEKERLQTTQSLLTEANPGPIIAEIAKITDCENLLIVGHEPFLSTLVSHLICGNPMVSIQLKKSGFCCLTVESLNEEPKAMLTMLFDPIMLD